jgi:hypothetical protein
VSRSLVRTSPQAAGRVHAARDEVVVGLGVVRGCGRDELQRIGLSCVEWHAQNRQMILLCSNVISPND